MDDEKYKELVSSAEQATYIDELIKTTGWREIVCPYFEEQKKSAMQTILNSPIVNDIFNAREKIKAIDQLINDLLYKLQSGEEAKKELSELKE